ncbi:MAG TPA: hypothetical protein PL059_00145 [Spirochaetota bacterium]|nr:hypothetical protein [Spirochaetota bacterium]HOM08544.1 hypothetical protein [Spirochaetota bacterium]HPP48363.1 hypothetical protein [Spirochaetota bacterium]
MKKGIVYFYCVFALILLQSCSSDSENIRKEGCINKNTVRIVVLLTKNSLPTGKLNNDIVSQEAVKIADQRCQTIISNAMAINKKQYVKSDSHVVSRKLVLVEKRKDGYMVIVDYTLDDEIASLLQCR